MKPVSSWQQGRGPDMLPDDCPQTGIPANITAQFGKLRQDFDPRFPRDPGDAPMTILRPPVGEGPSDNPFDEKESFLPDAESIGMKTIIVLGVAERMVTRDEIEGQSAFRARYNLVMNLHRKSGHRVPHKWTMAFNINKIIGRSMLASASGADDPPASRRQEQARSITLLPALSIRFPLKADRPW